MDMSNEELKSMQANYAAAEAAPVPLAYLACKTACHLLAMLIEGIDWRAPERMWKPTLAS